MKTITKHFDSIKKADQFHNRLYDEYDHVVSLSVPRFSEEGTYTWEVGKLTMITYRLVTLQVDPDNSVNDAHYTGETVELPENPTVKEVCVALKAIGRMGKYWKTSNTTLEENGDGWNVCMKKGKKIYYLEPERRTI